MTEHTSTVQCPHAEYSIFSVKVREADQVPEVAMRLSEALDAAAGEKLITTGGDRVEILARQTVNDFRERIAALNVPHCDYDVDIIAENVDPESFPRA